MIGDCMSLFKPASRPTTWNGVASVPAEPALFARTQQQSAEERQGRQQQRELQKQAEQAILDCTAGPALRRLYGLEDDPPQDATVGHGGERPGAWPR